MSDFARAAYRMFGDLPEEFEVNEHDADLLPFHPEGRGGCGHYHPPFEDCPAEGECDTIGCCH